MNNFGFRQWSLDSCPKSLRIEISKRWTTLDDVFDRYFSENNGYELDSVRIPFGSSSAENVPDEHLNELLELKTDSVAKNLSDGRIFNGIPAAFDDR